MSAHILFVDDEIPIRETLSLFFKVKGMSVTTAGTGAEALKLAENTPFDLVILDVKLADENGLDLLENFKQKYPSVPVAMFTAFGDDPERMNQATAKGASGWFRKGDSFHELFNGISEILANAS